MAVTKGLRRRSSATTGRIPTQVSLTRVTRAIFWGALIYCLFFVIQISFCTTSNHFYLSLWLTFCVFAATVQWRILNSPWCLWTETAAAILDLFSQFSRDRELLSQEPGQGWGGAAHLIQTLTAVGGRIINRDARSSGLKRCADIKQKGVKVLCTIRGLFNWGETWVAGDKQAVMQF